MLMKSRYPGKCISCGKPFSAGDEIEYSSETRRATHPKCAVEESGLFGTDAECLATSLGFEKFSWSDFIKPEER
jgi:hypothetical protein